MLKIVETRKTICSECGRELRTADDWSLCRRQHSVERLVSTLDGRRLYDMLIVAGFKDRPDPGRFKDTRSGSFRYGRM